MNRLEAMPKQPDPRSRARQVYDSGMSALGLGLPLDMSNSAGNAGAKSGSAFKENMKAELDEVDAMIRAKVQSWGGMLSFSARPSITPSISDPDSGKRSDSTSLTHSRHAAFSDATNFGYV
jgi:hypothetical protein